MTENIYSKKEPGLFQVSQKEQEERPQVITIKSMAKRGSEATDHSSRAELGNAAGQTKNSA